MSEYIYLLSIKL